MYFLAGEVPMTREGAGQAYRRGLAAAERAHDSAMVSEIAIQLGLWYWRTYDAMAHRRMSSDDVSIADIVSDSIGDPDAQRDLEHLARTYFSKPARSFGELDLHRARELFFIALRARPDNPRAWTYAAMSLVALDAWEELETAAMTRQRGAPSDPWTWMTAGLAYHRLTRHGEAGRAFERALALFDERERELLTRLTRLIRPSDSLRLATMSDADRARTERDYWTLADPLTLTPENEHWLEFLSRVAYSELMFTVEEFRQRGSDSPRGEVFIRYGPPQEILSGPPGTNGYYAIWWRYAGGLEFYFPLYGSTRMVDEEKFAPQRRQYERRASAFENLEIDRSLLPARVTVSRFRATDDSTDLFIAAEFPVVDLAAGIDLPVGELRMGLTTFGGTSDATVRPSVPISLDLGAGSSRDPLRKSWRHRFGGAEVGYRVEALQVESGRGARAVGAAASTAGTEFGLSDILLADTLIASAERQPMRWSDLEVIPSVGEVRAGRDLALVWETYALAIDSTHSNAYRVDIGLMRSDGTRIGRAVARVLGGTLGRGEGRGRENRVTVSFERRVPARPVTLDHLTLDLGNVAPGSYRLTITVTDLVASALAASERELTIVQ
jgi:GWxTD domain-containing protein